jgi:general secretion pathway protein M
MIGSGTLALDAWLVGRRGQCLAVAIALLAVVLVWLGLIGPLWSLYDDRQEHLLDRQTALQHMRVVADSLPDLRRVAADDSDVASEGHSLLQGDTDALAAAHLQERVQRLAAATGASLTAVETLPVTIVPPYRKAALRISFTAPWPVVVGLLQSINDSTERIFTDDVQFRASPGGRGNASLPIQTALTVYGLRADTGAPGP